MLNFKFQLIIFLPFNKISPFSNGSHLEWRIGMSPIILKVDQPKIMLANVDHCHATAVKKIPHFDLLIQYSNNLDN